MLQQHAAVLTDTKDNKEKSEMIETKKWFNN